MPTIIIDNMRSKSIHYEDKKERLLDILLTDTDWMHACSGKGKCTTCKGIIIEGMHNLSPQTEIEKQYLKLNKLQNNERLTCQAQVNGDLKIRVPKKTQLPHLTYSE